MTISKRRRDQERRRNRACQITISPPGKITITPPGIVSETGEREDAHYCDFDRDHSVDRFGCSEFCCGKDCERLCGGAGAFHLRRGRSRYACDDLDPVLDPKSERVAGRDAARSEAGRATRFCRAWPV